MTLQGKVAIITGGTGGLGTAVVGELLAAGASVAVPYQHEHDWERLRTSLGAGASTALHGAAIDLTDEPAVAAYYTSVAQEHGGIDILVNLAGGFAGGDPLHKTPWSLWQQQLDVNLKTTVISCQAAVPHMIGRGGAIVNVSSRTATQPGGYLAAYAAAKRAVLQLTEAMAAELRDQDITVNAILPSVIDTPANRAATPSGDYSKWVQPVDIARVILFLVGPTARIVSGAHVPVYGKA